MYTQEALELLGCSYNTLKTWAKKGRVRYEKLPDGRRLYNDTDVYAMIGKRLIKDNWTVTYSRVNSTTESGRQLMADQQAMLSMWAAAKGMTIDKSYEDWAPSTEYGIGDRPGMHQLLQDVIQKRVGVLIIETPDRLARMGLEIFMTLFRYYGVDTVILNHAIKRPEYLLEQEQDLMRILKKAGVDRLDKLGALDGLPEPKKIKIKHPGKITPNWEGEPLKPTSRDLSDLI